MRSRTTITKITVGAIAAGALVFTSLPGGVDAIGVGELQECTISKSMDSTAEVDGRDFLVWQRGASPGTSGAYADWQANYGVGPSTQSGGDVDGRDFLYWQRGGSPN